LTLTCRAWTGWTSQDIFSQMSQLMLFIAAAEADDEMTGMALASRHA
jgi:hypothetical protein